MNTGAVAVRPYEPRDRAAVRRICHQTGYMGAPADWYWRHAESFADIWTGYYTDCEPGSCFVAVRGDEVVGYLAGCVDSRAAPSPAAALARAALRHSLFVRSAPGASSGAASPMPSARAARRRIASMTRVGRRTCTSTWRRRAAAPAPAAP